MGDYRKLEVVERFPSTRHAGLLSVGEHANPLIATEHLASQMRRAVISVVSNIAEGSGEEPANSEFARFLRIALGSATELEAQLVVAGDSRAHSIRRRLPHLSMRRWSAPNAVRIIAKAEDASTPPLLNH